MKTINSFRQICIAIMMCSFMLTALYSSAQETGTLTSGKFLQESAISGMNTVALGNLGQKRLQDPDLKSFAQEMLNSHMVSNAKIKALAKKKKVKLPDPMNIPINSMQTRADTTKKDAEGTALDSLTTDFDAEFVQMIIDDHKKAIVLFEKGTALKDRELKSFAGKNLLILRKHLDEAE